MATDESERALIEGVLGRPFADATQAVWGFTNRTDIVTPGFGDRVVVQRYRRRQDAEYRDAGLEGPRFPAIARLTGELLASFRRLPTAGLELDDRWADPGRLVARASRWVSRSQGWPPPSAPRWPVSWVACLRCSRSGLSCSPMATSRQERADRRHLAHRVA